MGTDLATLDLFLREHGRGSRAITGIVERLRPFAEIARSGDYRLAAEELDVEVIASAIAAAVGKPVNGIVPLTTTAMVARMSRGERADHLMRTGVTIKDGLWLRLMFEHSAALDAALGGPDARQALAAAYDKALGLRLRRAFDARFRPVIGDLRWLNTTAALGDVLLLGGWNGVDEALFYWLAFTLAGDEARAARLRPLVALLTYAVPLCESAKEPGVWLALIE